MNWRRAITIWLYVGLAMVFVQIIVGGITRLTGSGLSITKWEIVTGTLPPLSESAWQEEFDLYKATPQYEKINAEMKIGNSIFDAGSFKFIYFWEYIHRFWARMMGFVFLFPFLFFIYKKKIPRSLRADLGLVVACAALAAIFGWIMVASGLINRPWVNAYKLAIHLSIGFAVFLTLLRAIVRYRTDAFLPMQPEKSFTRQTGWLFCLLAIQVFLGGIMSGTKAALFYPTWPDMRGEVIPSTVFEMSNWSLQSFIDYDSSLFVVALIQTLHRSLAYFITGFFVYILIKKKPWSLSPRFRTTFYVFSAVLFLQVLLGIITVLTSLGKIPVFWGVAHQGVAVLLIGASLVWYYQSKLSR